MKESKNMVCIQDIIKVLEKDCLEYQKCVKKLAEHRKFKMNARYYYGLDNGTMIDIWNHLDKISIDVINRPFSNNIGLRINAVYTIEDGHNIQYDSHDCPYYSTTYCKYFIISKNIDGSFRISPDEFLGITDINFFEEININKLWRYSLQQNQQRCILKAYFNYNGEIISTKINIYPNRIEVPEFNFKWQMTSHKSFFKNGNPPEVSYLNENFYGMDFLCNDMLTNQRTLKRQNISVSGEEFLENWMVDFKKLPDYIKNSNYLLKNWEKNYCNTNGTIKQIINSIDGEEKCKVLNLKTKINNI